MLIVVVTGYLGTTSNIKNVIIKNVIPCIFCKSLAFKTVIYSGFTVIESSSLVPVLFREVVSHPYISFFHLLFIIMIIIIIHFLIRVFSEYTEAVATSLIPLVTNFPEICAFIIGFSFTVWTKMRPLMVC